VGYDEDKHNEKYLHGEYTEGDLLAMAHIEVRPTRETDRDSVFGFCDHTWEHGDYIERVWDTWLNNPQGQLFTATAETQPVGIIHTQMLDSENAWIEGLRVDPQYRRQGIASALMERALLEAIQHNAAYVRLMTEAQNAQALALFKSFHMRQVSSVAIYSAGPYTSPQASSGVEQTQLATSDDLDDVINYLNASNVFPLVGGLYHKSYKAYPITGKLLAEKIQEQRIYLLRRWDRLDGLAIAEPQSIEPEEWYLSLGYIDGLTIEAISLIIHDLRRRLTSADGFAAVLKRIYVYAPDYVLMHDALNGMDYESNGTLYYTLERGLF
jgi:ribosomal protein S18 acetylase RimI-like enzyme